MKDILNKNTWDRPYAILGWGSLTFVLATSIVFFAAYGGTAWWVIYYARPDGQISTESMSFGLFRMCIRGDCVIDVTNKHLMNTFAPGALVYPILSILPIAQWLMSFDVIFIIILFFVYLAFLSGQNTYYTEVWLQFVICSLIIVSVVTFGAYFNVGQISSLPYGWSFWLAVVAAIMFLFNGVFMAFITNMTRSQSELSEVALIRKHQDAESAA
jgi:hypothetical protein